MSKRALLVDFVVLGFVVGISLCSLSASDHVFIFLAENNIESGLFLDSGGDVDTEVVRVGTSSAPARRTGNGMALAASDGNTTVDWYMQFRVDDSVLFEGKPTTHVRIEIEYFDEGRDQFRIQYDALEPSGPFGDGRFTDSWQIQKTDSGTFKTVTLRLDDVFFGNRNNGADFRIDDAGDGAETIRKVAVFLLDADSTSTREWPPYAGAPINATTLYNKVMFGYQGWFACPGDGGANQWIHWFRGSNPTASQATVDYWPDISELDEDELFPTAMTLHDGSSANVFSSQVEKTVVRHFEWMEEYELDGVFL